jgi:multidrug resistance protein, MATE family
MSADLPAAGAKRPREFQVTHAMVARLAVPMTLAYLSTPLLGIVDTGVVGRLGDPALIGGLAIGAIIIDVIFTTFNFQRSGTTGLAAQAVGAKDEQETQAILARALVIALIAGLAMIVAAPLILAVGLRFMAPGEDVAAATAEYFMIRVWSTPLALTNYAFLGWLIGLGRSGTSLALQVFLNGVNVILSIVLGLWLGFGITGVAYATVIAEAAAAVAGLAICRNISRPGAWPSGRRILDIGAVKRLFNLNADIMLRSFVLLSAFAYFTSQGAGHGEVVLAANAILLHFVMIGSYFLDGMATAAEQIVGRAVGASLRAAFDRGVKLTLLWNAGLAMVLCAFFLLAGDWLIALLTTEPNVRDAARSFLWLAASTPLTGFLAFQMDGVFIGATWSRAMSFMMLLSFAVYLASYALLPAAWGNCAIWLALHIFLLVRGVSLRLILPIMAARTFRA